jgi:hypothetical protein
VSAYSQGTYYERRAADALTADGYFVWLARGSKGAADLLAIKPGELLLVQVKKQAIFRDAWWNPLFDLAARLDGIALVADFPRRRAPVRFRRITGRHKPRSRYWPCDNWNPGWALP